MSKATLAEVQKSKQAESLAKFVDSAWREDAGAADLLDLAAAARLTADQADKIIGEIDAARPDLALSGKLTGLRQKARAAGKTFKEADAKNEPEIDRLEAETEAAAQAAGEAERAAGAAEIATRRLLLLADRNLVPGKLLTRGVLDLRDQAARNEELRDADRRRAESVATVNAKRKALREAERAPVPVDEPFAMRRAEKAAEGRIEAAQADLAEAEAALKAAEAEVEKLKSKK